MMNTTKTPRPRTSSANGNGGGKWCRPETRLAIYLRDGLACAYCGAAVEDGDVVLSLDHVICRSDNGSNSPRNLVTACRRCNSARGNRSIEDFAGDVAAYLEPVETLRADRTAGIVARVAELLSRPLPRAEAREMIARRGTAARAVAAIATKG